MSAGSPSIRARPGLAGVSRLRGWNRAVAASALVLVLVGLALGVSWLVTQHTRVTTYAVPGSPSTVELDLAAGSAEIVGGAADVVRVQRTDRYSFGHSARERRSLVGGALRVSSVCPHIVVGSCSASYRVTVPDDVTVTVRTTDGDVRLSGFRGSATITTGSGDVQVDAYCGFGLSATSRSGSIRVIAACAPERLDLRSDSGDASALVPPGRYRVLAASGSGSRRVSGVVAAASAPFAISVHSGSGDVSVEGGL